MLRMNLTKKMDPEHTALLVIDIQNDFCAPTGLIGRIGKDLSHMDEMIDRLEALIESAKQANVLTLYTQQVYDRSKLNDLQKEQYDLDGKRITCDIAGDGYEFYRLKPPSESVFVKYNYNCFSNLDLLQKLQQNNIKTLVVTGVSTQYCVETAVRNGFDLGYKIVVPADAIGTTSNTADIQQRTLTLIERTYGVVTMSSEIAKVWAL